MKEFVHFLMTVSLVLFRHTWLLSILVLSLNGHSAYAGNSSVAGLLTNAQNNVRNHLDKALSKLDYQHGDNKKNNPTIPEFREKWAILVGVDRFQDPSIPPYREARNNVVLLSNSLNNLHAANFASDHVHTLIGTKATKSGIEEAILGTSFLHKVLPNDLIVLYFSTRLMPATKVDDLCLCTYDTLTSEAALSGLQLKSLLTKLKRRSQCSLILCVLDCSPLSKKSFSANRQLDLSSQTPAVCEKNTVMIKNLLQPNNASSGQGLDFNESLGWAKISRESGVSILASSELGLEGHTWNTSHFSYFTEFLADGLKNGYGSLPLALLVNYVQEQIQGECQQNRLAEQKLVFCSYSENAKASNLMLNGGNKRRTCGTNVRVGHNVNSLDNVHSYPGDRLKFIAEQPPNSIQTKPNRPRIINGQTPDDDESPAQDVDFAPYMAKMRLDIQSKWSPPKGFETRHIITHFFIMKDGVISEPTIVQSSGVEAVDQSAMDALKAASPLDHLPKGAPDSVEIRYVFDWRVSHN